LILDLLQEDPALWVVIVVCGMLSVVLHELGHGFAALSQGDDTPRLAGHITWNPVVHMGWLSLGLLAVFGIAFGSTPVNPSRFRSRWGDAIVSGAGPAVNLVLFGVGATVFGLMHERGESPSYLELLFFYLAILNDVLLLFNLIPVPPLDGSNVLANLSPGYARFVRNPDNSPYLMFGLLAAFFFAGRIIMPFATNVVLRYVDWLQQLRG
jgi:Zn-dependent protease